MNRKAERLIVSIGAGLAMGIDTSATLADQAPQVIQTIALAVLFVYAIELAVTNALGQNDRDKSK